MIVACAFWMEEQETHKRYGDPEWNCYIHESHRYTDIFGALRNFIYFLWPWSAQIFFSFFFLFPLAYFYSMCFFLSCSSRLMYGFTVYLAIVYAWCMSILAGIIIIFPFGKFDWWLMESLNHLHYKASKGRQRATTTAAAAITQIYPGGTRITKNAHYTLLSIPFVDLQSLSLSFSLPLSWSVHPWLDVFFFIQR